MNFKNVPPIVDKILVTESLRYFEVLLYLHYYLLVFRTFTILPYHNIFIHDLLFIMILLVSFLLVLTI